MTGFSFLLIFIVCIALMIVMISKWGIHPFLSLLSVSLLLALVGGIGLRDIAAILGGGFAAVFSGIGIVILLGMLIGSLLEKTGAALKMANCVVSWVGKRHPELALLIVGWIVSIPVFCDSGFVMLNPIRKVLCARAGRSSLGCTVALASGLFLSHCLIPPTPGPMAAANALYGPGGLNMEVNLLSVMGVGVLCSVLPVIVIYLFVWWIEKKPGFCAPTDFPPHLTDDTARILPGAFAAFAPILLPVVLMGLSSALEAAGRCPDLLYFLGQPMMALVVGLLTCLCMLAKSDLREKGAILRQLTEDTLRTGGPILFVTAAGSVLGAVIKNTDLTNYITQNVGLLQPLGYAFAFLVAALLKSAQGSSTVAITTTAAMVAPLMGSMGWVTPISAALLTIAIGGGAMVVSHTNDSYFWVVCGFGELEMGAVCRTFTVATLLSGLCVLASVLLLAQVLT